ncbi:MAG: succinate dehydrogenase iron-sulfur subunit [bacterium]|nr:succinate dehydrogenase iron-sulfur subunit [bacterium]
MAEITGNPEGSVPEGGILTLRVARYDPERDRAARPQEWKVKILPGMTVLDALFAVKEEQDGSLAFRCSCRMGVCGSCGMFINGKPRLACNTQVNELGPVVEVAPLPNHDAIKDLVPDLALTFRRHRAVLPYIIRNDVAEMESPTREFGQTPEELARYVQFSYCLKCSLCLAACPTVSTSEQFLGPQALAQAYRFVADTRDAGLGERAGVVDASHGVFGCHLAGACSEACPKGVDPALGIQLLKRSLFVGPPHRAPAQVVSAFPEGYRTPEAAERPKAPPPSV